MAAASLTASPPAVWNAASEESTLCALPSSRVTRTSVTGTPVWITPCSSWCRTPFSTEPMKLLGTAPPTTWSTNSTPEPRGSGSTSTSQTAYWPCPPDCLTSRPWPGRRQVKVASSGTRTGSSLDRGAGPQPGHHHVGVRLAQAPEHQLAGAGVAVDPQRRVGRGQPGQRLGQAVLVVAGGGADRDRQLGFG